MNFTDRVQAAVAAITGKTTAVIDSAEHQALLGTIGTLTGDKQAAINERDTAISERDIALAALEGLADTVPVEEAPAAVETVLPEPAAEVAAEEPEVEVEAATE